MHCIDLLGLVFDTRAMIVGIMTEYRQEMTDLMELTGTRNVIYFSQFLGERN